MGGNDAQADGQLFRSLRLFAVRFRGHQIVDDPACADWAAVDGEVDRGKMGVAVETGLDGFNDIDVFAERFDKAGFDLGAHCGIV